MAASTNVDVLGTSYKFKYGHRDNLSMDEEHSGECRYYSKQVMIEHSMCDVESELERDNRSLEILAHEVFHAFTHESGLQLSEKQEEDLACWYSRMWNKMNNVIYKVSNDMGLTSLDI